MDVTVTEEDVVSDDVGSRQVPGIGALDGAAGITKDQTSPDGTVRIRLSVDVDDGRYELRCSLSRWNEKA